MAEEEKSILDRFSVGKMLLPVVIGLGVTALLIWRTSDLGALGRVQWTWNSTEWMLLALFSLFVRDASYIWRIHHLVDGDLDLWRVFIVVMVWEFASCIAPGIIGGGFFFAIWILTREGINAGKSITVITFTSFLDGIFLITTAPLVYFFVGRDQLFTGIAHGQSWVGTSIFSAFWIVYSIILIYKLFVAYALFINPLFVKRALVGIFSITFLRRWRRGAVTTGDQLITAANGLKNRKWSYWWPALLATFLSWSSRFSIVNCIVHAFTPNMGYAHELVIYGKQVIMGIIVLLSPTPGGSGLAEFIFNDFLGMYIAVGLAPALALLWRLMSYYPYIAIGAIILPRWVRRNVIVPITDIVKK